MTEDERRQLVERRATRVAGGAFLGAILSGIALFVVYATGGQTQLEGLFLGLGFGGVAIGLTVWAKVLIREPDVIEDRPELRSPEEERRKFREAYEEATVRVEANPSRRRFLTRLLAGAAASLGVALLLPFRSLGEPPGISLFRTAWEEGRRVVGFEGEYVRPTDLAFGGVLTVFPEGHIGSWDSQALLIRLPEDAYALPEGAPPPIDGVVCFSKVCTHAGCPIGLFRAGAGELFCPCHQSKFDALRGAEPVGGPTTRALPQLPLAVDDDGYLVAAADFAEPIGPAFWNMHRRPHGE